MIRDLCGPFLLPYEEWAKSGTFIDFSPVAVRPGLLTTPHLSSRFLDHVWSLTEDKIVIACGAHIGQMFGAFQPVADQRQTLQYDPATRRPNRVTSEATRKLYHGQSFIFQQSESDFKRERCHLPHALAADSGDYGGQPLQVSRHLHRLKQTVFKNAEYTVMCTYYPNGLPRPKSTCSKCYDTNKLCGP